MDLTLERFWDKVIVDKLTNCWNWVGQKNGDGYGIFYENNKTLRAHRFAYKVNMGNIPDGLIIDHLCRNRSCINPSHLEAVTQRENIRRGDTFQSKNLKKTHCPKGHLLSGDNLVKWFNLRGARSCKKCQRDKANQYYYDNKFRDIHLRKKRGVCN